MILNRSLIVNGLNFYLNNLKSSIKIPLEIISLKTILKQPISNCYLLMWSCAFLI